MLRNNNIYNSSLKVMNGVYYFGKRKVFNTNKKGTLRKYCMVM